MPPPTGSRPQKPAAREEIITISTATGAPTTEPVVDPWSALDQELSAWAEAGMTATFWWRDDDAVMPTPTLDRLLSLSARHEVPLALAVIPAFVEDGLAGRLEGGTTATILQHGWAHANHAPESEKKAELGDHRPPAMIGEELGRGAARLRTLFGERFLPVLTPPWNRIGPQTTAALPGWGYAGLSTFGPRKAGGGIARTNTHADIIDWRGGRDFAGDRAVLDAVCRHLAARRAGTVDSDEPTGLLTHHLDHDAESWDFIDRFLIRTRSHPAVSWRSAATLFDIG
ncbi:polysaccharide deacetylase family protein [Inquilinus sp. CAU 1745]|uniref:polysaccharide deacetylase family protein n=1 Tax=Inquilinus sp. CAU 1745 TaxID=3140369 RepID=UPI00325C0E36